MAQTVGIIIEFVHRDTHERFMRICILRIGIVGIIGRNDLDSRLLTQLDDLFIDTVLVADTVTHQLQVEVVPEDLFVFQRDTLGLFIPFRPEFEIPIGEIEMPVHLPLKTGGRAYKSFGMVLEQVPVDTRVIVETFDIGLG